MCTYATIKTELEGSAKRVGLTDDDAHETLDCGDRFLDRVAEAVVLFVVSEQDKRRIEVRSNTGEASSRRDLCCPPAGR